MSNYTSLMNEYKELYKKTQILQGDKLRSEYELQETVNKLKDITQQLCQADAAIPRWYGPSANYTNSLADYMPEEMENTIRTNLIMNSWWASWLPFNWMHGLAASYYSRKARRIYNNQNKATL
jgi:hypothetical protein